MYRFLLLLVICVVGITPSVVGQPILTVSPDFFDFGTIYAMHPELASVRIKNTGTTTIRIDSVAVEDLHRHGAASGVRRQGEDHLRPVLAAVATVTELRQRTGPAFEVTRGHVHQHQAPFRQLREAATFQHPSAE